MKKLEDLLEEDEGYFGPGTDLAISLAAVFMLMIAIKVSVDQARKGSFEIEAIRSNQMRLVDTLSSYYGTARKDLGEEHYGILIQEGSVSSSPDIDIRNEATLQRISFGSHVLFEPDEVDLLPAGQAILKVVSDVISAELDHVREIHIQGHADRFRSKTYRSNLELAAQRAMTVYHTLKDYGIDPSRTIMSATSFGEYVPVQRTRTEGPYSDERLAKDNDAPGERRMNRRIEIVLIYRDARTSTVGVRPRMAPHQPPHDFPNES